MVKTPKPKGGSAGQRSQESRELELLLKQEAPGSTGVWDRRGKEGGKMLLNLCLPKVPHEILDNSKLSERRFPSPWKILCQRFL